MPFLVKKVTAVMINCILDTVKMLQLTSMTHWFSCAL